MTLKRLDVPSTPYGNFHILSTQSHGGGWKMIDDVPLNILRSDFQVPIWVPVSIEDSYEREKQIQQKKRVKKYI